MEEGGTNYRDPEARKGSGAPLCCMILSLSVVSLFVHLQIDISRPNTSHSAIESQSFRFSVKILGRSALPRKGGGRHIFFFRLGAERALGGPAGAQTRDPELHLMTLKDHNVINFLYLDVPH